MSLRIDSKTVRRLKVNENIETKTLNKLCEALECKLSDIAEYVKESKPPVQPVVCSTPIRGDYWLDP